MRYKDLNGNSIKIGDILSLNGETDFETTLCGEVRDYKGMIVSFYGKDLLGRDCYDEIEDVCSDREVIGHISNWIFKGE